MSWFLEHSTVSLNLIQRTNVAKSSPILDVGGGASRLVDDLLDAGFHNLTVLDLSQAALHVAQERLGTQVRAVTWLEADITEIDLSYQHYAVWHDRAVFHFLTQEADRQKYVEQACHAVRPGGHVIVATFAPDGPLRCSGLEVRRYNPESLHEEFGEAFTLLDHTQETHQTDAVGFRTCVPEFGSGLLLRVLGSLRAWTEPPAEFRGRFPTTTRASLSEENPTFIIRERTRP